MKDITKQWIEFAKADIICSRNSLSDEFLTNIVAFHSQQTVEKCFKAILEEKGIKLPRIHNLVRLYAKIKDIISFQVDLDVLTTLDEVYTTSRYPGDFGLLPDGKPSIIEVKGMYNFAKQILDNTQQLVAGNNKLKS
ncbi:MAG: hypothetical protein DRJ05_00490 [Bacteroidetes bacterium]|nr:MAG: hypothetical protein DRJ05_00490 [Bacteroidota bacterium]